MWTASIGDLLLGFSRSKVVLYSSHNLFEAREIGRHVIVLKEGRIALFSKIADLRPSKYVVGIRVTAGEGALSSFVRKGDYYLQELSGPEEVPKFLKELDAKGVQVREVKEMGNPLEEFFS